MPLTKKFESRTECFMLCSDDGIQSSIIGGEDIRNTAVRILVDDVSSKIFSQRAERSPFKAQKFSIQDKFAWERSKKPR